MQSFSKRLRCRLHKIWLRTLKIDILTLFVSLTVITFVYVITYSYFRNYQAILNYSKGTMQRNASVIISRVGNIEIETDEILQSTAGLFVDTRDFSINDQKIWRYMLNILKFNPDISSFFLAFPNGNRLLVKKVSSSSQNYFISNPSKPLPINSTYIIKVMDLNQKPPEIWYYADKDFVILAQEQFNQLTINIVERPWYIGAVNTQSLFWTEPYYFLHTHDLGITASNPLFDPKGKLQVILGIDISFIELSHFLQRQIIGQNGRTFITDNQGKLLVPEEISLDSKVNLTVLTAAMEIFNNNHDFNFSFKADHTRYLCYISNLPSIFNEQWRIVTIVPFADFFSELISTQIKVSLITLLILLISILIIIYFSKRISRPIVALSKEVDKITNLDLSSNHRIHSYIIEIRKMDSSIAALRAAIRSFSHYVPKQIVQQLLIQGKEISLQMEKAQLSILFSDIQDFTTIAESHSLNVLMPVLNEYFDGLSKIILANQGTIDKYIGDSIMAFWGAPLPNTQHAIYACKGALLCHQFVKNFNKNCQTQGRPQLITRFGISSGQVVVGNIGTHERMNYTVIGDAVNTAARLQITDKIYHVNIIISETVYKETQDLFLVRALDKVEVRGKKAKIKIYELVALSEPNTPISATESQKQLCTQFTQAYHLFENGDYIRARQIFEHIHQQFPQDYPTQLYLNRLNDL